MKKLRFILISIVVLLTSGRAAAYDFESGGLYYNILDADAKTVEVTNINGTEREKVEGYNGELVIPASVANGGVVYQVKQIGKYAFYNSDIESLVIENGVESIQNASFYWCFSLKQVSFPSSLRSIGSIAFWNCSSLQNIVLPEGFTTLSDQVFGYCYNVKSIELPSTLTSIGFSAFVGMESVTKIISRITEPFAIQNSVFAFQKQTSVTSP